MFKAECLDFSGKSVIVTGAGRGIGRNLVQCLFKSGATVYAVSRTPKTLEDLKAELPSIKAVVCDVSNWDETRKVFEDLPLCDYLVNNAANYFEGAFMTSTAKDFDSMFDTNLKAVANISQIFAQKLIDAKRPGVIVNISSLCGIKAMKTYSVYGSSKAALDQLTRCMALELGPQNIRVNGVNPGGVLTEGFQEMLDQLTAEQLEQMTKEWHDKIPFPQKWIQMNEVSRLTMFLLSDAAPMVHGASIVIDGGTGLGM